MIQLCLACVPAYYIIHIYSSALTATAGFRSLILIVGTAVTLNLSLNWLLLPTLGAAGCCIAALVSQYSCALACYVVASRQLKLPFHYRETMVYAAAGIALVAFFFTGKAFRINVWCLLAVSVTTMLVLLATQLSYTKKYFTKWREKPAAANGQFTRLP